jgi:hypothetical protein
MLFSRLYGVGKFWLVCVCMGLIFASNAYAYIDPGSGALLWQMLVAGFVGALFYFRRFFKRSHTNKEQTLDITKSQE